MKIVISDNDHVNLAQEEAVFQKAGMDFTLYQCHTEEEAIPVSYTHLDVYKRQALWGGDDMVADQKSPFFPIHCLICHETTMGRTSKRNPPHCSACIYGCTSSAWAKVPSGIWT